MTAGEVRIRVKGPTMGVGGPNQDNCSCEDLEARELSILELKKIHHGGSWERRSWRCKQEGDRSRGTL